MTAPARPVIVIAGPTASGKSALAVDLAERLGGTVINADSMQVYAELEILTARPGPADLCRVPHRLYGILSAAVRGSAAGWRDLAIAEIGSAHAGGRTPILVGGTGLYLRTLIEGIAAIPEIAPEIRAAANQLFERIGGAGLLTLLACLDPVSAARLAPGDRQRLIRAWEVVTATGRPISAWQADPMAGPPSNLDFRLIVLAPPRDQLYAACDRRFEAMIRRGAIAEVERLTALNLDPGLPAMKALGVPELRHYLEGRHRLDQAIALAQRSTRHYAKRQVTWFRHQLISPGTAAPALPCLVVDAQYSETMAAKIFSFVCEKG